MLPLTEASVACWSFSSSSYHPCHAGTTLIPHTVRALVQVAHDVSSRTEAVCSLLCERVLASPHDVSTREASDVCLQCSDGVTFHAHSFVLCAFSEFFRSMMGLVFALCGVFRRFLFSCLL